MAHTGTTRNDGSTTGKTTGLKSGDTRSVNANKATAKPGESMVGENQNIGFYRSPKGGKK